MGFLKVIEIIFVTILAIVIFKLICQSADRKSNLKALATVANLKETYIKDGLLHTKCNITMACLAFFVDMFVMFGSAAVLAFDNGFIICGAIVAVLEVIDLLYNLISHICGFNTYNRHLIVKAMKDRTHKSVNKALTVEDVETSIYLLYLIAIIVGLFM